MIYALAIIPGLILLGYVYKKDTIEKESNKLLLKLFLLGCIAAVISIFGELALNIPISIFEGTSLYNWLENFIGVALVEEFFKFVFLKIGSWKNREFNYRFDGIVYAVFVSMGFAILENILYVQSYGFYTALIRAFTSLPGHATFGVFMGYYYGKAKSQDNLRSAGRGISLILTVLVPTIIHGFYDLLASSSDDLCLILFFGFVIVMDIIAIKRVNQSSKTDILLPPKF